MYQSKKYNTFSTKIMIDQPEQQRKWKEELQCEKLDPPAEHLIYREIEPENIK